VHTTPPVPAPPAREPLWFLLADIHIADRTLPRLQPFFAYFFSEFAARKPSHVVVLGDTFDVRRGTDPMHHRVFTEFLEGVMSAEWAPSVHLLVGNQ
jgi:UDP-2,3-diacylglucosamine pyrophosphatase LpxH